jgi:enediyne biosynthesis protein E4
VAAPGAAPAKRYVQRMRGTNGTSSATLHFGFGGGAAVDRVDVRWPNGKTQTVTSPSIDARLEISEP